MGLPPQGHGMIGVKTTTRRTAASTKVEIAQNLAQGKVRSGADMDDTLRMLLL